MSDHEAPEMLRTPVEELCLMARSLRLPGHLPVEEILDKAINPPHRLAVENAVTLLTELGAFEANSENMTPLGWKLSQLPIHPCLGKMLLLGTLFTGYSSRGNDSAESQNDILPLIHVCSTLSFKSPFTLPFGKEKEADRARKNYGQGLLSDHLLFAKVSKEYNYMNSSGGRGEFAQWLDKNFLSKKTLEMTDKIKVDLQRHLKDLKLNADSKTDGDARSQNASSSGSEVILTTPLLNAILAASLSISFTSPSSKKVCSLHGGSECSIHPSSLLSMIEMAGNERMLWRNYKHLLQDRKNDEIVEKFVLDCPNKIFIIGWFERLKTSDVYLRDCTLLSDPLPLLLLLPGIHQRGVSGKRDEQKSKEQSSASPFAEDATIFEVVGGKSSQGGDSHRQSNSIKDTTQPMLLLKVKDDKTAQALSSLRTKLSNFFDVILSSKTISNEMESDVRAVFHGLKMMIEDSHSLYLTDAKREIKDTEILEVRQLHNSAHCEVLDANKEDGGEEHDFDSDNEVDESMQSVYKNRYQRDSSWRGGRGGRGRSKHGRGSNRGSHHGGRHYNNSRW